MLDRNNGMVNIPQVEIHSVIVTYLCTRVPQLRGRTVLSYEPDAISLPSSEKATEVTKAEGPLSGLLR
jgi:hypothetical protein